MKQEEKSKTKKDKKGYEIHEKERLMQDFWQKEKIYAFDLKSKKEVYSIDTPPPTVSGIMHVGHALSYTHKDIIARYWRMKGYNIFYPWGFDDNGLPTERYVEKKIGKKATEMSRDEFIKLCLKETKEIEEKLLKQWKSIGISPDWNIKYRTIDERSRKICQKSFIELFKKKRAYRRESPVLWCPECNTAIAQVELEDKEKDSEFCDVVFEIKKGREPFIVSTTRPEFLPACVAVFYHPHDKRYKKFKHKQAIVPLFNFAVPILEDKRVDMEKGTGIVMCCTFGDTTDIEWWKAYGLAYKDLLTKDGKISSIGKKYAGKNVEEARKLIIEDLDKEGKLKGRRKIKHIINVHERCGTEIEFIVAKQWFIKYLDLKDKFLELGKKIRWFPKFMKARYDNWIKGLQWDWCISRQRYFGVPFPVWYCERCETPVVAKEKDLPIDPLRNKPPIKKCPKCGCTKFIPEKDVIDTWATSSMTPDIAIDIIHEKNKHLAKKLHPMSLRPQAQDIITFWAFNTIVKSWFHHKEIPWKDIMISGWGLDSKGKKMSKSKNNVVEPQEIIDKYCADSLRFWAASVKLGENVWYSEKEFIAAKKLIIKMWNAFKFALLHLKTYEPKKIKFAELEEFDKFIFSKTNELVKTCTDSFEDYNYSKSKLECEKYFWHLFCDNFLEIIKNRLYNGTTKEKESAKYVLYDSLLKIIKLFAPVIPHVTEAIYQEYFRGREKEKSIHLSEWPIFFKLDNKELNKKGEKFLEILEKVRKAKANKNKSVKSDIALTIEEKDYKLLKYMIKDLSAVCHAKKIKKGKFNVKFL